MAHNSVVGFRLVKWKCDVPCSIGPNHFHLEDGG
jgi:hypothetical protein